jgi:peptidoglycan/LPS O-acetylase OafA/YrhL
LHRHNNFDLLRLVAAASVIFSHSFLLAERTQANEPLMVLTRGQSILGLVGVFIFFTISGYLISQSLETTRSPLRFLLKRGLRIFPGLAVCLLVCAFVVGPLTTSLPLGDYLAGRGPYLFVLRNLALDVDFNRLPGVVFGPGDAGGIVNGPLWSLPCEVLMYLMVLGLGLCRLLTLRIGALLLASGMLCIWLDTATGTLGSALWLLGFFAAGMCCYRLRGPRLDDGRLALAALLGLALSIPAGTFILTFPLFGGYLTIYLAITRRLPVVPAARFGDLSYGLYIYGWPVEQCILYIAGETAPWWEVFALALAVTVPLAWLSWHYVESRCRLMPGVRRHVPVRAAATRAAE